MGLGVETADATADEGSAVSSSIRPGDVLADRYRLVDLLSESGGGRFWRAHDRVLERHVALHVIAEDDERAAALVEAARRSATVHDRRLLRVLDADRADGVCYVVNEWGAGDSLDVMLAADGPLGARRAAWIVSEVAAAIAAGHQVGVAHGRLIPENVLIDHTGGVRVIGFAVDAALHGLPAGRVSVDVTDLAALLYTALTGRWPGIVPSLVASAPAEGGRVLRPRRVRAGIPKPLDSLCDEVLNPYAAAGGARLRETHDLATAQGIADYLSVFVGDATGLAEAEAAEHRDSTEVLSLPPIADPAAPPDTDAAEPDAEEPDDAPDVEEPDADEAVATELPTQAGLPIFGEDDQDDVAWLDAPGEPAPPPPPFEEPPERPLFAPAPAGGGPVRTPRATEPTRVTPAPEPSQQARGFWPWDNGAGTGTGPILFDDEEPEEVPGRNWLRLALLVGLAVLLLLAVVVSYNLGRGRTPLGAVPDDETTPSTPATGSPSPTLGAVVSDVTATDFDPQGSPPRDENPELAPLAVDGDRQTSWRTQTYDQNFGPGGLKDGVGLVLDLGAARAVSAVDLTLGDGSTEVSLFVTARAPTGVGSLTPAATATVDGAQRVTLDQPAQGRFVTVWLTSIPAVPGGFRGEVAEAAVRE